MKHKRFFYTMTVIIYAFVLLFSFMYVFTVKSIRCNYNSFGGNARYENIDRILSSAEGKNILFVDTSDLKKKIQSDPYVKVASIKKVFPNKLEVKIQERREMFCIVVGERTFVLDENYYVLSEKSLSETENLISFKLNVKGYNENSLKVGQVLDVVDEEVIKCVNGMLSVFTDWKNLLSKIEIEELEDLDILSEKGRNLRAYFQTCQGCLIEVQDVLSYGEEKGLKAYNLYTTLDDLSKSDGVIYAYELENTSYPDSIVARYVYKISE